MSLTIGTAGRSDRGSAQRALLDEAEFEPARFGAGVIEARCH